MKQGISLILCVVIVLAISGCTKFEADAGYKRGTYNGKLSSLLDDDYEQLSSFLYEGEFAGVSGIVEVRCKDYLLIRGLGAAGSADVLSGVFYEEGLVEYNENSAGEMYDRFRKDYVFEISKIKGNETYWFTSYYDVEEWLKKHYT